MSPTTDLLNYTLQLADNALINGHRLSEWCGHGPVLEQDIAISNIALDHLGAARSLFQYAAELANQLNTEEKKNNFASPLVNQNTGTWDEDDLAFLRDSWDFRNVLLVEQPNRDWAYTVARSFFLDSYNFYFYRALQNSKDSTLAAIAEKSLKEATYHLKWSSEWMIRLGDGTEESHARIQEAVNSYWVYVGELTKANALELKMQEAGIGVDLQEIKRLQAQKIKEVLEEATLNLPAESTWIQEGGKEGRHSEHLGYLLAEMQFMQRAYPNMEW